MHRNGQGVLDRWIFFILIALPFYILLAYIVLDIIILFVFNSSLKSVTHAAMYHAQKVEYYSDRPLSYIANEKCRVIYDALKHKSAFVGYKSGVRDRFLNDLSLGAKELTNVKYIEPLNGCYYREIDNKRLFFVILEGRRNNGDSMWPFFTYKALKKLKFPLSKRPFLVFSIQKEVIN